MKRIPLLCCTLVIATFGARADWLQYRGPAQNGVSSEKGVDPLAANKLKILWRTALGKGTSSVTVQDGRAYTMGNVSGNDVLYCLDVKSGKEVWRTQYPMSVDAKLFEGGPRSTPTVDGVLVYTVSHQGDLQCFDTTNGKRVWGKNFVTDFGGRRPGWGYSGSPLVYGDLVICDAGGPDASTIALDKSSGKTIWKSGADEAGYATPVVATLEGKQTLMVFKAGGLIGYDVKTGKEFWRTAWKTDYDINAATPLLIPPNKIFITSGYNAGCALVEVNSGRTAEVWRNKNLRYQINSPVVMGGSIFGVDGNVGGGNLVCLDVATGQRRWEEKGVKGGAMILADGKLLVFTEKGELVICEATPASFHPLSRGKVLDHRCWAQPTLDSGRLYLRNNEGDLVCLDVSGK